MEEKEVGGDESFSPPPGGGPTSGGAGSTSTDGLGTPLVTASPIMLAKLVDFITAIAPPLLVDASPEEGLLEMLQSPTSQDILSRFIIDSRQPALYLETTHREGQASVATGRVYKLNLEVSGSGGGTTSKAASSSVAFIKRGGLALEEGSPLAMQLQVITLGPGMQPDGRQDSTVHAFFSLLQQYTKHSFAPLIKSFINESGSRSGVDGHADANSVIASSSSGTTNSSLLTLQKKLMELELALAQCQKSMEIPSVELVAHPEIAKAAGTLREPGARIDLEALGLSGKARDDNFLNAVQGVVNQWVKEIQRVTRLTETAFPDTALEEVNFWRSLEEVLRKIEIQLMSPSVQVTLAVLKQGRRIIALQRLENDTGLDASLKVVADVLAFLRDLPINTLLSVSDLDQMSAAVMAIFQHMNKLKTSKYYDLERAGKLLESVSRSLAQQIKGVVGSRQPMKLSYADFQALKLETDAVFAAWRVGSKKFDELFLQLWKARVRSQSGVSGSQVLKTLNATFEHLRIQQRFEEIAAFRAQHERFCQVVEAVLKVEDEEALRDVEAAYARFLTTDVLDISSEGKQSWNMAREGYETRVDRLEDRIIRLLCDKLASTRTADEMFRVFSKFNPLFFRPRIRAAIAQFQADLIKHVRDAVQRLQEKFTQRYEQSEARVTATLRDIPPVAGKVLWARQIERQLRLLMQRMEDVLGAGWEKHVEGRQLKSICDELLRNLDTETFFKKWIRDVEEELSAVSKKEKLRLYLLLIGRDRHGEPCLNVNFDDGTVMLFKEVRNLTWLGFRVPAAIKHLSDEASDRYPYAMALQATLRTYSQTRALMTEEMEPLLLGYVKGIREVVNEAFMVTKGKHRVKWDSPELSKWVTALSERVFTLQEKADDLIGKIRRSEEILKSLETCPYEGATMQIALESLQVVVDDMNLAGFTHIDRYVASLESRLETLLLHRLSLAMEGWVAAFRVSEQVSDRRRPPSLKLAAPETQMAINLDPRVHEIVLQNQILYLVPPLERTRAVWISQLHGYIGVVCNLSRLKSSRFDVFGTSGEATFADLARKLPKSVVVKAYDAIQTLFYQVTAYVDNWLQYQALWDMSSQMVYNRLGNDLSTWLRLLMEMKAARTVIEQSQNSRSFGPLKVDYSNIQGNVNLKYDAWQKELQSRFGGILADSMKETHAKLSSAKSRLEGVSLEGASKDVIVGVTFIQEMRLQQQEFQKTAEMLELGEKLLIRQRFAFPTDWPHVSNVLGALDDFHQILERRATVMEEQIPALQQKVRAEDKVLSKRITDLVAEWASCKPLQGDCLPKSALEVLAAFDGHVSKARSDFDRIGAAKVALSLDVSHEDLLKPLEEEVKDLREVWSSLMTVWEGLQALKDGLWSAVVPRKLRQSLDGVVDQLRSLPNRIRQYEAFTYLQNRVKAYQGAQMMINELKTEALKERHWRSIIKQLSIKATMTDLTLGHLWDSDLTTHKAALQEILTTAQGEMALEVFLRQVREQWVGYELEMVTYRSRVRLIRGWDVLFAKLEEHLNSLASMKLSPFFRNVQEFQEETQMWEDRLSRIKSILDCWIQVQRRWVYLEGIFFGSADIKAQLPSEYSRFKSIDTEFVQLMRKISAKPIVLEILQVDNLLRQLERQESFMSKIQKALGEYLKRQRAAFSRFYFVGDEDLLEIIGNSSEPAKVTQHLSKMFASLGSVKLAVSDPATDANASFKLFSMLSKEGEEVPLKDTIIFGPNVAVKEWLKQLEDQMRITLAHLLQLAVEDRSRQFSEWVESFPTQVIILAVQIWWSSAVEAKLSGKGQAVLDSCIEDLNAKLLQSVQRVLSDVNPQVRKKYEQLITEFVHERDVTRALTSQGVQSSFDFPWLYHLRFYWTPGEKDLFRRLGIRMANSEFYYGFEYLGIGERLVQTPLTDRCYLTLTQALHFGMGGNPFGPAGTGKTESVKALGAQLGRFVLVFNCDENFDYSAMGRLFAGLCQVGAWGCFDEFNRLEERILSAVSQQILTIQRGLAQRLQQIDLLGEAITLHPNVGIFVTMNPGYAGRSNLPDNLKQLFRAVAMTIPDRGMIAQVMLFSQGIETAEELAGKIVLLFDLCEEQLSPQSHYDFGLRALKSVLVGAGSLKRDVMSRSPDKTLAVIERDVLIMSTCSTVVPKLVAEDLPIFRSLLQGIFPGCDLAPVEEAMLKEKIVQLCEQRGLVPDNRWLEKVLQLKQVLALRHGVMLVGPSGSGKTAAWRTLFTALESMDGLKGEAYVIDPKAINKDQLYGTLDSTTLEWTDGVFTSLLRQVLTNIRGESGRIHWIIFDGDVDPEWAENLNSVLDDNKLLTLPSGERLEIPPNVRIVMEVDSLRYATLATVSRCGMVWFSDDTVSDQMLLQHHITRMRREPVQLLELGGVGGPTGEVPTTQSAFIEAIESSVLGTQGVVKTALKFALGDKHIMETERGRLLETFFSLMARGIALALEYDESHPDFHMSGDHMERFANRWLLFSMLWGFGSSMFNDRRLELGRLLLSHSTLSYPPGCELVDLQVNVEDGEWVQWSASVPRIEIESHRVVASDVVVPTTDTLRHVEVMRAWLASHRPLILCGPPGSGKTMTLTSTLQSMPHLVLASLNFSSGSTPDLILKTFAQYCDYIRTPRGTVLQPAQSLGVDKWLVIFCDEINLPENDRYGTQRVISFLRQLTEAGGFWRPDCTWVTLNRIQFVGACNPPTDAGRVPLSHRFLRHAPVLLVDFPARDSLRQIYRTFASALLKLHPSVGGYVDPLTDAMIDFYGRNQGRFTPDQRPQYVYSPRELSRWIRALYEALAPLDSVSADGLVRVWGHEGLRLFHDRLTSEEERDWCDKTLDEVASKHFPGAGPDALARPILFSKWLSKNYQGVSIPDLRNFVAARLKVFYEEELDVPLVIFDDVLEHVLRIDGVLRQPMGHLLLVGESGVGKTVLSRFVSWMNGLSIFQVKASSQYTLAKFDEDLRTVMKRAGINGDRICFIFDESNALSSAFLERMNALLASGEVPGLFDGDDFSALMAGCREAAQRSGVIVDSEDELFRRFTREVQRNLHVVFTMNPASSDFDNRCTTSPALFNRCVVDWFGTWSKVALTEVANEFTMRLDTGGVDYQPPRTANELLAVVQDLYEGSASGLGFRHAVIAALVNIHLAVKQATEKMTRRSARRHYISPRDYLDLIKNFVSVVAEKREQLEELQLHINVGLDKLASTQISVELLQAELAKKREELKAKDLLANAKLQQMVADQNEAERRKAEADAVSLELDKQNTEIAIRREEAQKDLAEAEPALIAAQQSVKAIKKSQLDEVRALVRPPNPVRLTLEAVVILLGEKTTDWGDIRKIIRNDGFIPTVVNFNPESINPKQVKEITDNYLSLEEFEYENVNRASKACGPLSKWVVSQLRYSDILKKVQPLRDEVAALQAQSDVLQKQKDEIVAQIEQLETSIARYKGEYADAIREIESIKGEMDAVSNKVRRAEALLASLNSERDRWHTTSTSFQNQLSSLVGDALLSASFLTYAGTFDHRSRGMLVEEWRDTLERLQVPFRMDLSPADYLAKPAQLLEWQSFGLPKDQLCMENAIILERFNRFPLVIDPSGQATQFLINKYASRKLHKTSFLDSAFLKTLASSIRFGTPLLVQDVETVDPILNPVLNREFQRTGGRTIIRLGSEDIDFSPKFVIIMVTRNPSARFAPDLTSRVTMVNFTVTPASLQTQALSQILRSERPDVDRRRTEVLRLQGEQNVRLRELEDGLLNQLSAVQGNILDDDRVIKTLEELKAEAADVGREVASTAEIMAELKAISDHYEPLAFACSQVYFTLEQLADVHFLYQYSIQYFLRILEFVLSTNPPPPPPESQAATSVVGGVIKDRIPFLKEALLSETCRRAAKGLLQEDQIMFTIRLTQIYLHGEVVKEPLEAELDYFFRGPAMLARPPLSPRSAGSTGLASLIPGFTLDEGQRQELAALSLVPSLVSIQSTIKASGGDWARFLASSTPERDIPEYEVTEPDTSRHMGSRSLPKERRAFLDMLIVRALRRDRLLAAMEIYIAVVMGDRFPWRGVFDLEEIIKVQSLASSPMLLCSEPGHDASGMVDRLADTMRASLTSMAMGSEEGFETADKLISSAAQQGTWVLLRNIHLCPTWLEALEKRLHNLNPDSRFRLFLTSEVHPRLPTSLLRLSDVMVVEAPTGVRANVVRFLSSVSPQRMASGPVEKARLYFVLAWFNALVQERLRYVPLGWSKRYEFSQADAASALDVIDSWITKAAAGKAHVSPEAIPWDALRTMLSQSIYGGRVDNPFDQRILDSFVSSLFRPECFDVEFALVNDGYGSADKNEVAVTIPEVNDRAAYLSWLQSLPTSNPPTWLGLPPTVEAHLLSSAGTRVASKVLALQDVLGDEAVTAVESNIQGGTQGLDSSSSGGGAGRKSVMLSTLERWLDVLRQAAAKPVPVMTTTTTILQRCLAREWDHGRSLLEHTTNDLAEAVDFLRGKVKASKALRALVNCLATDAVPPEWIQYNTGAKTLGAGAWVMDFSKRITHLQDIFSQAVAGTTGFNVWLGGLFFPEAFVTATRQHVAERLKCSLQELYLSFELLDAAGIGGKRREDAFAITGLTLEGASWDADHGLHLSTSIRCPLSLGYLSWVKTTERQGAGDLLSLPVYLNDTRINLICEMDIPKPKEVPDSVWSQRGVAFIAWSSTL